MGVNFTVIKKNQILAGAVTLMLVTAGYLNYKYDPTKPYDVEVTGMIEENLGDAVLVNSQGVVQNPSVSDENIQTNYTVSHDGSVPVFQNDTDLTSLVKDNQQNNSSEITENVEETKKESSKNEVGKQLVEEIKNEKVFKEIEDYFISTRIDRTNHYAEQIENYENILLGENTSETQKNKAQEEIERINGIRNSIMIAENLIRLKGFDEAVVLVNEKSINVIVASDNLSGAEVAQIQSIIMNEFQVEIENVHIINYD